MSEQLKPCPACGRLQLIKRGIGGELRTNRLPHIECYTCGMGGPHCSTIEEAVTAWNALPRTLEWTNEPPKMPGWYWMFCRGEVVIVPCNGVEIMVWGDKIGLDSPELEGVAWAGPIPEPHEPK